MDFSNFLGPSEAHNEFRSDTFTTPTLSMIQSLTRATVGDSVYNEDNSTLELEQKVAKISGKEAGLFCVSGTLANQVGVRVNLKQPPYNVLCDFRAHIYVHEAGGLATLSQAMVQPIVPKNGVHLTLDDDILPNYIPDDGEIHAAPTKLICLENTLHGMVFPLDEIVKIAAFCKANDVKLHLDGARLFNASVETGILMKEYCSHFDTVSICLSKTLGAPVGSVLVSDAQLIKKANHFRKQAGGGIRQSGILATMAITAIDENVSKLRATHERARELGNLCESNGIVLAHPVQTNFVFIDFEKSRLDSKIFDELLKKYNVKLYPGRISFHYQISDESFENIKKVVLECLQLSKQQGSIAAPKSAFYQSTQAQ